MVKIGVILNGDNCWPDLVEQKRKGKLIDMMGPGAGKIQLAVLDAGMTSGKPSVTIRIDLPDGSTVLTETSARLFCSAARMIAAKYPGLFEE